MDKRTKSMPTHLTITQASRYVGVAQASVSNRIDAGNLKTEEWFETTMVRTDDCRRWKRDRDRAARKEA